ncbi:MAG: hypothetical protein RL557_1090 [archaeon]|jgi:hypothetical protein
MPETKIKETKEKESLIMGLTATRIKAIIMSVIIAIVLSAFVIYLTESIYPGPKWDDYCGNVHGALKPEYNDKGVYQINETECVANGGSWRNNYCDYYYECQQAFNKVDEKHKLVVFVVSAIAGIVAIALGIILALPSVSSGLMIGGGFLMIYGTSQYWYNLTNWLRAILLGVVLVILIWLAYKKLKI